MPFAVTLQAESAEDGEPSEADFIPTAIHTSFVAGRASEGIAPDIISNQTGRTAARRASVERNLETAPTTVCVRDESIGGCRKRAGGVAALQM